MLTSLKIPRVAEADRRDICKHVWSSATWETADRGAVIGRQTPKLGAFVYQMGPFGPAFQAHDVQFL